MKKKCLNPWCQAEFEVTAEDLVFLKKFEVTEPPATCPLCRHLHRGSFRATLKFYKNKSALSGKDILR